MSSEQFKGLGGAESQLMIFLSELRTLASAVEELVKHHQRTSENVYILEKVLSALNNELKTLKNKGILSSWLDYRPWFMKSPVKVKVTPVVAAKTFGAHEEILSKVNMEVCANPADCDVVVVFCPVVSRVGSDVDDAMKKIPEAVKTKPVVLMVMHHSVKDISPAQLNHGHHNIVASVQILFHESKNGLIKCERNDEAIHRLQH